MKTPLHIHGACNWFEEKTQQLSVSELTAFGIRLTSRYGKAAEMAEMLNFAAGLARCGLHIFVREVLYDSQACICAWELNEGDACEIGPMLDDIANQTISQFIDSNGLVSGAQFPTH